MFLVRPDAAQVAQRRGDDRQGAHRGDLPPAEQGLRGPGLRRPALGAAPRARGAAPGRRADRVDGEVIGAIGVSGASSADEDRELAELGARSIASAIADPVEVGRLMATATVTSAAAAARPAGAAARPARRDRRPPDRRGLALVGGAVALRGRAGRGDRLRRARLAGGPARAGRPSPTAPTTSLPHAEARRLRRLGLGARSRPPTRCGGWPAGASASTGTGSR